MEDLLILIGMIGICVCAWISAAWVYYRPPKERARMKQLRQYTHLQLHAELTRCVGEIAECSRRGDRKGMRRARRKMRPVIRVLQERGAHAGPVPPVWRG